VNGLEQSLELPSINVRISLAEIYDKVDFNCRLRIVTSPERQRRVKHLLSLALRLVKESSSPFSCRNVRSSAT